MEDYEWREQPFFKDPKAQLDAWCRALLADDIVGLIFQPGTGKWFLDLRIRGEERVATRGLGYLSLLEDGDGNPLMDSGRRWLEIPRNILDKCRESICSLGVSSAILDEEL